ncbi:MAG: hypothetical protein K2L08_01005 [Erysipelotrichaceae bacterium]|nr:hypothetical protein [Erysipelotrichaceae bacterium]
MVKDELYNMLYKEILDMLGNKETINLYRLDTLIEHHGILSIYKAILKSTLLTRNETTLLQMFQDYHEQEQKEILDYFQTYGFDFIFHNISKPSLTVIEKKALEAFRAFPENLKMEAIRILRNNKKIIK